MPQNGVRFTYSSCQAGSEPQPVDPAAVVLTTFLTYQRAILPYTSGGNYFDEIVN
jgi:hypothetical protein